jgi:hypothetical protein
MRIALRAGRRLRYGWLLSEIGLNRVMGETRHVQEQGLPAALAQLAEAIAQQNPSQWLKSKRGRYGHPHRRGKKFDEKHAFFVQGVA